MKPVLTFLAALLLAPLATLHAADAPVLVPLWPAGKMPGVGAEVPEKQSTSARDGLIRVSHVSEPTLTVFRAPSATEPTPAVIICPGGNYAALAMDSEGTKVAAWLNTLGITGIVLKYRVPQNQEGAFQDIQRALRLVRARQKESNIDPARVGVMGFSAGGHLSARASIQHGSASYPPFDEVDRLSSRPDFAVLVYPAHLEKKGLVPKKPSGLKEVPPTLIVHSEDDKKYVVGSKLYVEALVAAKVTHEYALYPTGGHGYGLHSSRAAKVWPDRCAEWFKAMKVLPKDPNPSGKTSLEIPQTETTTKP